ncbi:MAG: hypothetical protein AB1726_17815 [Planctomycetota bacterium]
MFACATEREKARRGSALVGTLVVLLGLLGLLTVTLVASTIEVKDARRTVDDVRLEHLADSGFEAGMHFLADAVKKTRVHQPLQGITDLFALADTITPFVGEHLTDSGVAVGGYSVSIAVIEETGDAVTVEIESTGYLPDAPVNLPPGVSPAAWRAVRATVRFELAPSEVFDYAYFINNWGWFYGDTIVANGNVRSNGQFDAAGYAPWVNCQPLYDAVDWDAGPAQLIGYRDDNLDGLEDGNDGGIFSGWDIVDAENVRGRGGEPANQHDFLDPVEMPNLTDLALYEDRAVIQGGTITIGGAPMSDAVYGDEAGERQNLYLTGTAVAPIVIDGPVVVRGDVILRGYVTGQGAIYAGGNVYCPSSVQYVNAPATTRPAGNTQAETEAWLTANADRDFLGLFARENVVVGNHTNSTWRYYVSGWMASSLNKSEEDAGEDRIPNTAAGRDGVAGTADDDVLEDDGTFTVEYYTAEDQALGLIPPGYSVGDAIPGTGEDIDGDGQYDDTTTLADVDISTPLNTTYWGGNMPGGGIANYNDISTLYANRLDAVFYTNHSFCYVVLGSTSARINGALVSRNENIIYGTPTIEINYDCRLLGGNSGIAGSLLPQVVRPPVLLRWTVLDADPNRYLAALE